MLKRGLSDVVATVLIVLLAVAAVVIIWGFISDTLTESGTATDLASKCLLASAVPKVCTYDPNKFPGDVATVTIRLETGKDVSELVAVIKDEQGAITSGKNDAPSNLETVTFDVNNIPNTPKSLAAAVVVINDGGEEFTCQPKPIEVPCTESGGIQSNPI